MFILKSLFPLFLFIISFQNLFGQQIKHPVKLRVIEPQSIQGDYHYGEAVNFGPEFIPNINGELVWAYDINGDSTACDGVSNDLTGKIALIRRGICAFTNKVLGAQDAGALAVIIVNNVENNDIIEMSANTPPALSIPAVFISGNNGKKLSQQLDSGKTVKVEFHCPQLFNAKNRNHNKFPLKQSTPFSNASFDIYNASTERVDSIKAGINFITPSGEITTYDTLISTLDSLEKTSIIFNRSQNQTVFEPSEKGWHKVQVFSSLNNDTLTEFFEVTQDIYSLENSKNDSFYGVGPSNSIFTSSNIDNRSHYYDAGMEFIIENDTAKQDSMLFSFGLENPEDFMGEYFNTLLYYLKDGIKGDINNGLYPKSYQLIGVGSYQIQAKDTLEPHQKLITNIKNINTSEHITQLTPGYYAAVVNYHGEWGTRPNQAPRFSHTTKNMFLETSGLIFTDRFYPDGWENSLPVIQVQLVACFPTKDTLDITECDSFRYNNITYHQSGIYTHNFESWKGCDSVIVLNLTINQSTTDTIKHSNCGPYQFKDSTYSKSGIYTILNEAPSHLGCDSFTILDLTIKTMPDTTINISQNTLVAYDSNGIYQWLECPNYEIVANATERKFEPTTSGSFALQIESIFSGCIDTSYCYGINLTNENDIVTKSANRIYPNPAKNSIQWNPGIIAGKIVKVEIFDALGHLALSKKIIDANSIEFNLPKGLYFVVLESERLIYSEKLIVKD